MQQSVSRIVFLTLFAPLLMGQTTTAELTGRVTDHTQAVIPGALIHVMNLDSGIQRSTSSNDTGNFTVPFLAPGNYIRPSTSRQRGRCRARRGDAAR